MSESFDPHARGDNWLQAYYFGFSPTGCEPVDRILAAVASAGKSAHNTADWNDPDASWHSETAIEAIQRMADEAAESFRATPPAAPPPTEEGP
jgi:hypothetical protein